MSELAGNGCQIIVPFDLIKWFFIACIKHIKYDKINFMHKYVDK